MQRTGQLENDQQAKSALGTLREIARRHGTPAYAYDLVHLRKRIANLRAALPASVKILYSLKANASLGLCGVIADCGLGADVASHGELLTALAAGFPSGEIFAAGPHKPPAMLERLRGMPDALVSVDSSTELRALGDGAVPAANRVVLRLRPDFESAAVVTAGQECRFGLPFDELPECREIVARRSVEVVGFHVFAGSQILDPDELDRHLRSSLELALRAAGVLGIAPAVINLGGGFGIPYGAVDRGLDLDAIGAELESLARRVSPAGLVLELGRYIVAQAGWYLTSVVGHQTHRGHAAVIVDGGTHQRADLCGLGLRNRARAPLVLTARASPESPTSPTDVLGCLSLPEDVLAHDAELPPLSTGDVLAFPDAGAYGLHASPALFHGMSLPAELAFEDAEIQVIRARQPSEAVLAGQRLLERSADA